jgi:glucose-6-phosphate 1-dehydrogenase
MVSPTQLDLMDYKKGWAKFTDKMNQHDRVRVYYLAVVPSAYGPCCKNLSKSKLITDNTRLVVEKPIGYDLPSAEAINETMAKYFEESQIYRIDHYLGKETVQNLLTLRFTNFLFEDVWDNKSIDHIQISISEKVGLEGRAGFYDDVGALRDMVQNHLLQLLCLMAMDSPNELNSESIRFEKVKVLKALKPITGEDVDVNTVRGQYVSGKVDGEKVEGYLDELENYDSKTETFVAIKAQVNSWRWAGVPFYLRTGKRLNKRMAQIVVQFKDVTHNLYKPMGQALKPNQLLIMLQPEEHIEIRLMANDVGGGTNTIEPKILNLDFDCDENVPIRTAYQRLILDAVLGDSTLFIHRDEVTAAWKWIDPIVEHWAKSDTGPKLYPPGSWGPDACKDIFEKPSQHWHNPGENND